MTGFALVLAMQLIASDRARIEPRAPEPARRVERSALGEAAAVLPIGVVRLTLPVAPDVARAGYALVAPRLALGRLVLATDAGVSSAVAMGPRPIEPDPVVDVGASAIARAFGSVNVGVEARARAELVDVEPSPEDAGRTVAWVAGGVGAVPLGRLLLGGFAGIDAPRGPVRAGPLASIRATVEF